MSPQQVLIPSSPDSDGVCSMSPSPFPPSTPSSPPSLPLLRALDERQLSYLLVISLRHLFASSLPCPQAAH